MRILLTKKRIARTAAIALVSVIGLTSVACSTTDATQPAAPTLAASVETAKQNDEIQSPPAVLDSLTDADKTLTLAGYGAQGALADDDMSVADMLTYAIQDEYLAHGEYAAIIDAFGNSNPYSNIIRSEETHIAYLDDLFASYDLDVPADDSAEHLVVPGSLLDAAKTGVQAEISNIAMYEKFLGEALPLDVMDVFSALKNASESHLQAFERQVDKLS